MVRGRTISGECPCPSKHCSRHGNCKECVRVHRIKGSECLPYCLRKKWIPRPDLSELKTDGEYRSVRETKVIRIDYLYLDLVVCDRCIGTDKVLKNAVDKLRPVFDSIGYSIELNNIEIENAEMAKRYRFRSSPTVLVNGNDICSSVVENRCGCCGDISGTDVSCRVFMYNGKGYEVPPEEMLIEAIMMNALRDRFNDHTKYVLPKNLEDFFNGKESGNPKKNCCC